MKSVKSTLDERLQILLDQDTHNDLKAEAIEKGLGKSSLIRTLLKERYKSKKDDRNEK